MTLYKIQKKIKTLSDNFADIYKNSFEVEEFCFRQWDFNYADGCLGDAWIVEAKIDAINYKDAYSLFHKKLQKIVTRISLVCQTYINGNNGSVLITSGNKNYGYVHYIQEDLPVGLMFMEEQKRALDILLENNVRDEFFYYWNDAVNTTGYTAKILLMASAIEALIKKPNGTRDYELRKQILGDTLDGKIFRQTSGLRHRLVHGEYLSEPEDVGNNYVIQIHKRIVEYFNEKVIKEDLISENVVDPQRNFIDNYSCGNFFIKPIRDSVLDLKPIIFACEKSRVDDKRLDNYGYDYVFNNETNSF